MTIAASLQRAGPVGALLGNTWNRVRAGQSEAFVAHHGLQRSGTNYLLTALYDLGLHPLNAFNPRRDNPRHKHFRWQPDKTTIRLDRAFANTVQIKTPQALDRTAEYPAGTRHVVLRKPLDSWVPSILNWGLRCGWWPDTPTALDNSDGIVAEYRAYYSVWQDMADQAPNRIVVLDSAALRRDPLILPDVLDTIGLPVAAKRKAMFTGIYTAVAQSPTDRADALTADDRARIAAYLDGDRT